jgi:outer membrane biosynthesis protein TonB
VPDQLAILRLAALLVFIGLVAVGLWLLDVAWWVVPPVMAVALFIAWTIEWLAWRGSLATTLVRETTGPFADTPLPPATESPATDAFGTFASTHAEARPLPEPEPPPGPSLQPQSPPEPELQPEPEPLPAPPAPEPDPGPAPTPEPPPEPVVAAPVEEEPSPSPVEPRRPRRLRLRPVPPPRLQSEPEREPAPTRPAAASVVEFRPRTIEPREWNLWDLERIARAGAREHPERRDEWSYLFIHLRQFAQADGSLPTEFDGLVRETFAGLLERPRGV